MFDRFIGLGFDCEVVAQLRRLTGDERAQVLDWQVVPHESLVHVLRTDFADYLQRPNLVLSEDGEYVLDTATGIQIYHLFPTTPGSLSVRLPWAPAFPQVRARADHLLRRWRETVDSPLDVLYLRRDPEGVFTEPQMVEIRDAMRERYPAHRFALVWAHDAPAGEPTVVRELGEGLYAAGIHVAQPAAVHWRGDDAAWDSAFPALTNIR
jgi:hypothetical protein